MKFYNFEGDGGPPVVVRLSEITGAYTFGPRKEPGVNVPAQIRLRFNKKGSDICASFDHENTRDRSYTRFIAALEVDG